MGQGKRLVTGGRMAAVVLGVSALVIAAGYGLNTFSRRQWEGRERFTVIDLGPPIIISSFDPATGEGVRLRLPEDLEIAAVGGRGKWTAGRIGQAGSAGWAADSVADSLGIFYVGRLEGLGPADRWMWMRERKRIRWRIINLEDTGALDRSTGPDGVETWILNANWKALADKWLDSLVVAAEGLTARVVNTTGEAGLGAAAARAITSSGIRIGEVTESGESLDQCVVRGDRTRLGVRVVARRMGCALETGEGAEMEVRIGRQYLAWKKG